MKASTKASLAVLGVVVILPVLGWTGTFLYWHFRIRREIRDLEAGSGGSFGSLRHEAGCRALPYLVGELDPEKPPFFLERATLLMAIEMDDPGSKGDAWSPVISEGKFNWRIAMQDSLEQRRKKCNEAREYWKHNGSRHHQLWRIWTRACVPN